ncbi:MAG: WXG100 family type VII secretion target [Lachnospiraceae bacterium]|nr:WXG100 family type VII secretion target [Lachnospiraceae bacterium]
MALIRVTASQVRNTSSSLRDYNQNFSTQVQNLQESEASLSSMWEGQAKDAFHAAFESDKEFMIQFNKLVDQYCQALDNIAAEYEKAENVNTETARTRSF